MNTLKYTSHTQKLAAKVKVLAIVLIALAAMAVNSPVMVAFAGQNTPPDPVGLGLTFQLSSNLIYI